MQEATSSRCAHRVAIPEVHRLTERTVEGRALLLAATRLVRLVRRRLRCIPAARIARLHEGLPEGWVLLIERTPTAQPQIEKLGP